MSKRVLITGSNGFIGKTLINHILENTDYDIVALARSESSFDEINNERESIDLSRIICITNNEFLNSYYEKVDIAVHLAFSRNLTDIKKLSDSLTFTNNILNKFKEIKVKKIINVSSQSVYGMIKDFRKENMSVCPSLPYSMAKYAEELLLNAVFDSEKVSYCSIRLDNIIQSQRLVRTLCNRVINGLDMELEIGQQYFSYIDIEDAADAIIALIAYNGNLDKVYNIGHNCERYTLLELAEKINDIAMQNGLLTVKINSKIGTSELYSGMDTSKFMKITKWKPNYNIDEMIYRVLEEERQR